MFGEEFAKFVEGAFAIDANRSRGDAEFTSEVFGGDVAIATERIGPNDFSLVLGKCFDRATNFFY